MINKLICADDFAITTNVSKAIIKLLEKKNLTTSNQTRYLINQEYSKALGLV